MEAIPRDYGEQCRFDAFCKTVLRNEARNYHRDMKRQRDRETSFSVLPQAELDKLYTVDHYPSDDFVFSSHGYDLHFHPQNPPPDQTHFPIFVFLKESVSDSEEKKSAFSTPFLSD